MKHPAIREVFRHWDERRAGRLAPERSDIEPSAIRGVLADTFIIGFDPTMGHRVRVAGTRVCALFGREIKGEGFLDLFWRGARDEMRDLIAIVTHDSMGVVASARELAASGCGPTLELLVLPLRFHGRTDARVLGGYGSKRTCGLAWAARFVRSCARVLSLPPRRPLPACLPPGQ
jgi:hypothetical protein